MIRFLEKHIVIYFIIYMTYSIFMMVLYYTIGSRNLVWFCFLIIAYVLDIFYFFSSLKIFIRSLCGKTVRTNLFFPIGIFLIKIIIWNRNSILRYLHDFI